MTTALTSADPSTGYAASAGSIVLKTGTRAASSDLMTNGAYVVVSHGANAIGGTPLSASDASPRWCDLTNGTEIDRENCDIDNGTFFDALPNGGNVVDNSYDDIVVYNGKESASASVVSQPNAFCFGPNDQGQLGTGTANATIESAFLPLDDSTGVDRWKAIATSGRGGCAISDDDQLYCWVKNYNPWTNTPSPLSPMAIPNPGGVSGWRAVATGAGHNCAIANHGEAYCWGISSNGALGHGGTDPDYEPRENPTQVVRPAGVASWKLIRVAEEARISCGIGNNDQLYCWGYPYWWQLGSGKFLGTESPDDYENFPGQVVNPPGVTGWTDVSIGFSQTCGIGNNGKAYCWGDNDGSAGLYNRLGTDSTFGGIATDIPTEVIAPSGVVSWSKIAVGMHHTCGIAGGEAYCWGWGANNALANEKAYDPSLCSSGTTGCVEHVPYKVVKPVNIVSFEEIAVSRTATFAIGTNNVSKRVALRLGSTPAEPGVKTESGSYVSQSSLYSDFKSLSAGGSWNACVVGE